MRASSYEGVLVSDDGDNDHDITVTTNRGRPSRQRKRKRGTVVTNSDSDDDDQVPSTSKRRSRKRAVILDSDSDGDMPSESDNAVDSMMVAGAGASQKTRRRTVRVAWTEQELDLLIKTFSKFMNTKLLPGFEMIETAQKRYPILQKRTPAQIKSRFVQLRDMAHKQKK